VRPRADDLDVLDRTGSAELVGGGLRAPRRGRLESRQTGVADGREHRDRGDGGEAATRRAGEGAVGGLRHG
jgi:hypothetical protein